MAGEELHVTVLSACPLLQATLSAIYKQSNLLFYADI